MNWWTYVRRTADPDMQTEIAKKIGVSAPSVSRWANNVPKPENVAAFARAYGRPVLEAFIAAGFLDGKEAAEQVSIRADATALTDDELLEEVARRMKPAGTMPSAARVYEERVPEPIPRDVDPHELRLAAYGSKAPSIRQRESWDAADEASQDPEDYMQ